MGKMNLALIEAYNRGYRVLQDGSLVNPQGKIIKCNINFYGYKATKIRSKSLGSINILVHRLAAYQKFGHKVFKTDCVRHLDGNKLNNSISNIEIGTLSDNMMDIPKQERVIKSSKSWRNRKGGLRYSDELVKEIRAYYEYTKSYKNTMEKFNISHKGTLCYLLKRRLTFANLL